MSEKTYLTKCQKRRIQRRRYRQALLDIKEYIEKCSFTIHEKYEDDDIYLNVIEEKDVLDIVNKALNGSDENE